MASGHIGGAWALEIAAAIIGLATGLALGFQAFSASHTATAMDLTLASAPFFMVAIAELTKIPIATLQYLMGLETGSSGFFTGSRWNHLRNSLHGAGTSGHASAASL